MCRVSSVRDCGEHFLDRVLNLDRGFRARFCSEVVLAAAKRSARARGRSTGRGGALQNGESSNANGSSSAHAVSFEAANDSTMASSRREELLRRLNQITEQRYRLERKASVESEATENGFDSKFDGKAKHELSPQTRSAGGHHALKRTRQNSVDQGISEVPERDMHVGRMELNGENGKRMSFSKRCRSESISDYARTGTKARREQLGGAGFRTGTHRDRSKSALQNASQRNRRTNSTSISHEQAQSRKDAVVPIDLERSEKRRRPEKLDLTLVEVSNHTKPNASSPLRSPLASPSATRGSARVRTPSVLLSSHPGEKVPSLQKSSVSKNKQVTFCLRIVKEMLRLKDAFGFSKPIMQLWSPDQLPGYFDLIKHPMDLDTVRKNLESGLYLSSPGKEEVEEVTLDIDSFSRDMRLIFNNARTYNREGDVFYEAATRLLEKFEAKMRTVPTTEQIAAQAAKKNKKRKKALASASSEGGRKADVSKRRKGSNLSGESDRSGPKKPLFSKKKGGAPSGGKQRPASVNVPRKKKEEEPQHKNAEDISRMSVEALQARLRAMGRQRTLTGAKSPASSPAAGGGSYMAHAQALYHVEMTYEEKVQLSENVSKLPPDKLSKIVALATRNKSASMEVNKNEEIELDIDSMNNKTLRDMEAYVNQTLFRKKKCVVGTSTNADVYQMSHAQVVSEIEKLSAILSKRTRGKSRELMGTESRTKDQKSFYDSDSTSESGDSDGSDSSSDDSATDDSSEDESDGEQMRRRREQNLAHQQAMRAAGTPLPSPSYQGGKI